MREWTYYRRLSGLRRCCLDSLDSQMVTRMAAGEGPPEDGETFTTHCCQVPLVHRDGAWESAGRQGRQLRGDPLTGPEELAAQVRAEQESRVEEVCIGAGPPSRPITSEQQQFPNERKSHA